MDTKTAIRLALNGSSSQKPTLTENLYTFGERSKVEAALLEMYQANEVCCCKITRRGVESVVWYLPGANQAKHNFTQAEKK